MQGRKTVWTEQMLSTLKTAFPVMCNVDLARMLGVSRSVVSRKARELGLHKDEDFLEYTVETRGRLTSEGIRRVGHRGVIRRGEHRSPDTEFQKGHRLPPDVQKRRNEKAGDAIRKLFVEERNRVLKGLPQRTKVHLGRKYDKLIKI